MSCGRCSLQGQKGYGEDLIQTTPMSAIRFQLIGQHPWTLVNTCYRG